VSVAKEGLTADNHFHEHQQMEQTIIQEQRSLLGTID